MISMHTEESMKTIGISSMNNHRCNDNVFVFYQYELPISRKYVKSIFNKLILTTRHTAPASETEQKTTIEGIPPA